MNKIASYLQQHLSGEVLTGESVLDLFSTDASPLQLRPHMVVYPRSTNDVRKVARFSWQLAEKGHVLPITSRGGGSDQTGAAIGSGIVMAFTAHMDRLLEIDTKQRLVRVQPGLNFKSLQETLFTHGLSLPPQPSSYAYSTVGGAIANNASGIRSYKYGAMREWVDKLEVVLANGEVIETGRIGRKEVERRKGLPTMEGELYRAIDGVISDYTEQIEATAQLNVARNNAGYELAAMCDKDGSIDLTPLFVGSQGTLGVITEAILRVAPHSPESHTVLALFESDESVADAAELADQFSPSSMEMLSSQALGFIQTEFEADPLTAFFEGVDKPVAAIFVEFDEAGTRARHKKAAKLEKRLQELGAVTYASDDYDEQQKIWALRTSTSALLAHERGGKMALPVANGAMVPAAALPQFTSELRGILEKHHIEPLLWGHVGEVGLQAGVFLDLRKLGDRQKLFKLNQEYAELVMRLGGTITGISGEGRMMAVHAPLQYGADMANAFREVKKAADPHGTLNPGVKLDVGAKELTELLRKDFSYGSFMQFAPWQ